MINEPKGNIYIFGAHSRSQTLGVYLKTIYPDIIIQAYLVDNDEINPTTVDGIPVIRLDCKSCEEKLDYILDYSLPVYLGTRGVYHSDIISRMKEKGFKEFVPVTVDMDIELRNIFVRRYFKNIGRNFSRLSDKCDPQTNCCIYVVKSVYDKQTTESYDEKTWERYIQVGCTLTDERLAECTEYDNIGDNISYLNRQFCELTGLYWIWKNSKEDIVGLEHYRRHFTLDDNWCDKILERNIDVILPVPLYVHPSIAENYRGRHEKKVWEAMMSVLRRQPEVYIAAIDFFENTGCYSPCNMIIARRDALNDLCEWLFPILFEVAGRIGQIDDTYQNRYPGFLSERLITFFFYYNADKYNVVYADKNFIQ